MARPRRSRGWSRPLRTGNTPSKLLAWLGAGGLTTGAALSFTQPSPDAFRFDDEHPTFEVTLTETGALQVVPVPDAAGTEHEKRQKGGWLDGARLAADDWNGWSDEEPPYVPSQDTLDRLFVGDLDSDRYERVMRHHPWMEVWHDTEVGVLLMTPKLQRGIDPELGRLLSSSDQRGLIANALQRRAGWQVGWRGVWLMQAPGEAKAYGLDGRFADTEARALEDVPKREIIQRLIDLESEKLSGSRERLQKWVDEAVPPALRAVALDADGAVAFAHGNEPLLATELIPTVLEWLRDRRVAEVRISTIDDFDTPPGQLVERMPLFANGEFEHWRLDASLEIPRNDRILLAERGSDRRVDLDGQEVAKGENPWLGLHYARLESGTAKTGEHLFFVTSANSDEQHPAVRRRLAASIMLGNSKEGYGAHFHGLTRDERGRITFVYDVVEGDHWDGDQLRLHPGRRELLKSLQAFAHWAVAVGLETNGFRLRVHPKTLAWKVLGGGYEVTRAGEGDGTAVLNAVADIASAELAQLARARGLATRVDHTQLMMRRMMNRNPDIDLTALLARVERASEQDLATLFAALNDAEEEDAFAAALRRYTMGPLGTDVDQDGAAREEERLAALPLATEAQIDLLNRYGLTLDTVLYRGTSPQHVEYRDGVARLPANPASVGVALDELGLFSETGRADPAGANAVNMDSVGRPSLNFTSDVGEAQNYPQLVLEDQMFVEVSVEEALRQGWNIIPDALAKGTGFFLVPADPTPDPSLPFRTPVLRGRLAHPNSLSARAFRGIPKVKASGMEGNWLDRWNEGQGADRLLPPRALRVAPGTVGPTVHDRSTLNRRLGDPPPDIAASFEHLHYMGSGKTHDVWLDLETGWLLFRVREYQTRGNQAWGLGDETRAHVRDTLVHRLQQMHLEIPEVVPAYPLPGHPHVSVMVPIIKDDGVPNGEFGPAGWERFPNETNRLIEKATRDVAGSWTDVEVSNNVLPEAFATDTETGAIFAWFDALEVVIPEDKLLQLPEQPNPGGPMTNAGLSKDPKPNLMVHPLGYRDHPYHDVDPFLNGGELPWRDTSLDVWKMIESYPEGTVRDQLETAFADALRGKAYLLRDILQGRATEVRALRERLANWDPDINRGPVWNRHYFAARRHVQELPLLEEQVAIITEVALEIERRGHDAGLESIVLSIPHLEGDREALELALSVVPNPAQLEEYRSRARIPETPGEDLADILRMATAGQRPRPAPPLSQEDFHQWLQSRAARRVLNPEGIAELATVDPAQPMLVSFVRRGSESPMVVSASNVVRSTLDPSLTEIRVHGQTPTDPDTGESIDRERVIALLENERFESLNPISFEQLRDVRFFGDRQPPDGGFRAGNGQPDRVRLFEGWLGDRRVFGKVYWAEHRSEEFLQLANRARVMASLGSGYAASFEGIASYPAREILGHETGRVMLGVVLEGWREQAKPRDLMNPKEDGCLLLRDAIHGERLMRGLGLRSQDLQGFAVQDADRDRFILIDSDDWVSLDRPPEKPRDLQRAAEGHRRRLQSIIANLAVHCPQGVEE